MVFNLGDRVRIKNDVSSRIKKGWLGTVLAVSDSCGVEFDNLETGHNLHVGSYEKLRNCKPNHGWWVHGSYLEKVEPVRHIEANAIEKWIYESSSSPTDYTTLKYEDGEYSCNCPGWTRRVQPDGTRTCKHVRMAAEDRGFKEHVELRTDTAPEMPKVYATSEVKSLIEDALKPKHPEVEDLVKDFLKAESVEDRAFKAFNELRSYGFLAYHGLMNTRFGAVKLIGKKAKIVEAKGIPIAGYVWTDRDTRKHIKRFGENKAIPRKFRVCFDPAGSNEKSVAMWIVEVIEKFGFSCTYNQDDFFISVKDIV